MVHVLPPRRNILGDAVLQVDTSVGRDRDEGNVCLNTETGCFNEGRKLVLDLFEPRLLPLHRRLVHLVDHAHDLRNAGGLDQHDVLPCLPALLEPGLELALASRDDEDRNIRLRGTGDHGRDERLVTWGVEDRVPPCAGFEVRAPDLDGLSLRALLRGGVESPRQIPRISAGFLGLPLVLLHRTLVDHAGQEKEVAAHGALPRIDVTDEDDV